MALVVAWYRFLAGFRIWAQVSVVLLVLKILNSISYLVSLFSVLHADSKVVHNTYHDHLTHWGRVTHLCVSKLTSIAPDNGSSPRRRQAIIWNNAWILLIGTLGKNFSEIFIEIQTFSLMKIRLKMSSAKCRPICLGLNVLIRYAWQYFCGLDEFHIKCGLPEKCV